MLMARLVLQDVRREATLITDVACVLTVPVEKRAAVTDLLRQQYPRG